MIDPNWPWIDNGGFVPGSGLHPIDNTDFTKSASEPTTGFPPGSQPSIESFMNRYSELRNLLRVPRPQRSPLAGVINTQLLSPEQSPGFQLGQNLLAARQNTSRENLGEILRRSGLGTSGPGLRALGTLDRQGDVETGNLALQAGQQGVQNALSFEPMVQGNFLNELTRAILEEELYQKRQADKQNLQFQKQAGIGSGVASLLAQLLAGGGGGTGGGGLGGLLGKGASSIGDLLSKLFGGGGDNINPDFFSGGMAFDEFGNPDPAALFGGGGGGSGGGGLVGTPPGSSSIVQSLMDALGFGGGSAAGLPAFFSGAETLAGAEGGSAGLEAIQAALSGAEGAAGSEAAIGGLSGVGDFLGAATGPLAALGIILGAFLSPTGQMDFPQDLQVFGAANRDLENQLRAGQPLDDERIQTAGWGVRAPGGGDLTQYLQNLDRTGQLQIVNGQYLIPVEVQRALPPGNRSGGPMPGGPWFPTLLASNLAGYIGSSTG